MHLGRAMQCQGNLTHRRVENGIRHNHFKANLMACRNVTERCVVEARFQLISACKQPCIAVRRISPFLWQVVNRHRASRQSPVKSQQQPAMKVNESASRTERSRLSLPLPPPSFQTNRWRPHNGRTTEARHSSLQRLSLPKTYLSRMGDWRPSENSSSPPTFPAAARGRVFPWTCAKCSTRDRDQSCRSVHANGRVSCQSRSRSRPL